VRSSSDGLGVAATTSSAAWLKPGCRG
jgi:hypothetical protein